MLSADGPHNSCCRYKGLVCAPLEFGSADCGYAVAFVKDFSAESGESISCDDPAEMCFGKDSPLPRELSTGQWDTQLVLE